MNRTYEPDLFFYNYDGQAYGDEPAGYWDSNLPAPYVDTQAFDGPNEKAVTVGSAVAHYIYDKTQYYYTTRMTSGAGSSSWIKTSSQRGARIPDWCQSTACSFGCSTNNNYVTLPFQAHYSAPGCYIYWWEWNITTHQPYAC